MLIRAHIFTVFWTEPNEIISRVTKHFGPLKECWFLILLIRLLWRINLHLGQWWAIWWAREELFLWWTTSVAVLLHDFVSVSAYVYLSSSCSLDPVHLLNPLRPSLDPLNLSLSKNCFPIILTYSELISAEIGGVLNPDSKVKWLISMRRNSY